MIACNLLMPNTAAPTLSGFYTLVPVMIVVNYTLAFGVGKLVAVVDKALSSATARAKQYIYIL